jgi:hypothetical protein
MLNKIKTKFQHLNRKYFGSQIRSRGEGIGIGGGGFKTSNFLIKWL